MKPRNHKKILKKSLVIFSRIIAIFFAVLLIIVTLLNVPAVQTSITKKIAARISRDYHIDISLGTVKIALPKTLSVGQLFIAGRDRDTLLYLNRLDVDLGILGLLRNEVRIKSIEIDQLTGNVFRGSPGSAYNFQFILDAFAGDSLTPETSAAPWKISVGKSSLKAIKGRFRDETLGMDALIDLGNLEIRVESIDLNSLSIVLAELKLENTRGKLEQWT
ncbi:MAG: AsmA family protein, partial [Bacteroidales bacterium]|nr:AsmA family protein [Bacteroidales bacterium]